MRGQTLQSRRRPERAEQKRRPAGPPLHLMSFISSLFSTRSSTRYPIRSTARITSRRKLHIHEDDEVARTRAKRGETKLRCITGGPGKKGIGDEICIPCGKYDIDHPVVVYVNIKQANTKKKERTRTKSRWCLSLRCIFWHHLHHNPPLHVVHHLEIEAWIIVVPQWWDEGPCRLLDVMDARTRSKQ